MSYELARELVEIGVAWCFRELALDACGSRPSEEPAVSEVVGGADEVERLAHQRRLDDATRLDLAHQPLAPKPFEPRPESDVRGGRPLRLQRTHAFDRTRRAEAPPS